MDSHRHPEQQASVEEGRLLASTGNLRDQIQLGIDQADRGKVLDHETVFVRLRSVISVEGDK
ncbi:MAG: hypothetical protein WD045_16570 [Pirellulaceae bacterium]